MAGWRGVRRGSVLVVVVALVALATGCQEPYKGPETGPKVAVIGDSISSTAKAPSGIPATQAYDNIHLAFESKYRISVSGVSGTALVDPAPNTKPYLKPESNSLPRARDYATMTPQAVVIELGTNDATEAAYASPGVPNTADAADVRLRDALTALRGMIDALPDPACIVVVTVGGHPRFPYYHSVAAHWNNDYLKPAFAGNPRVRIADWAGEMDAHYAAGGEEITAVDLVHLSEKGQDMLAALMRKTVDDCLPKP